MPLTPVAFCSVHSNVIIRRTSLPFFAIVTTLRHALPAAGRAAAARIVAPPTKLLARAAAAAGIVRPRRADAMLLRPELLLGAADDGALRWAQRHS